MDKFETDLEKKIWTMLYKSQMAFAKMLLLKENETLLSDGRENEWPALQEWNDLGVSSKAIFMRKAREYSKINHDEYLNILRGNEDALCIAEELEENT